MSVLASWNSEMAHGTACRSKPWPLRTQAAAGLHIGIAAVSGDGDRDLTARTAAQDVAKIVCVEHPLLAQYTADGYTAAARSS